MDDQWPSFRLLPVLKDPLRMGGVRDIRQFSEYLLNEQVRWFIRLRWAVVAAVLFCDLGAWGNLPILGELHELAGVLAGLAGFLLVANVGFYLHSAWGKTRSLLWELWIQIIVDLVAIGVVVLVMGAVTSYAPLLYIPHIVLACLFFKRSHSCIILFLSLGCYLLCFTMEFTGAVKLGTFASPTALNDGRTLIQVGLACFILCVTWYLCSKLSKEIRQRDKNLADSHALLVSSFEDHRKRVLQIAHQMKSPVASIRTCANLYRHQHNDMDADLAESFDKIDSRCDAMLAEIDDMLFLSSLRGPEKTVQMEAVDVEPLLDDCIKAVEILARSRNIMVRKQVEPCSVLAFRPALKKLVDNLLTNAVNYSLDSGAVAVRCWKEDGIPIIAIEDSGIGIPAEKLPNIFEEYYRTAKAQEHCRLSTGLGLSIVREVAALHSIEVQVRSKEDQGTEFQLRFQLAGSAMEEAADIAIGAQVPRSVNHHNGHHD